MTDVKIHTYFQGTIHKSSTAGRIMNQFAGIMNNMQSDNLHTLSQLVG